MQQANECALVSVFKKALDLHQIPPHFCDMI